MAKIRMNRLRMIKFKELEVDLMIKTINLDRIELEKKDRKGSSMACDGRYGFAATTIRRRLGLIYIYIYKYCV